MTDPMAETDEIRTRLLEAAMMHVPFDGWSETSFRAAVSDCEIELAQARAACPRGAIDLAVAFHEAGDREMIRRLAEADLSQMRFRDRIAHAVQLRLESVEDKEMVRRGATLFALPPYAPEGAKLIWGTADKIWSALGDTSDDLNWYSKRATLSGVYSATVLYWLGDDSPDHQRTWNFLDRRIEDVMRFEKLKAQVRDNPVLSRLMAGPERFASRIRKPGSGPSGFPGRWSRTTETR